MNFLLSRLANNPAVQACTAQQPFLSASSLTEEALILAASYAQNPRPMLIVKNNLYTAQRLAEKLKSLLSPQAAPFQRGRIAAGGSHRRFAGSHGRES